MRASSGPSPALAGSAVRPPAPVALLSLIAAVEDLSPELIAIRRDLHAHPELAWTETRTTTVVAERLKTAGVEVELLPTSGLVATIGSGGPLVGLRADLDALPVNDLTGDPWRSTVPGVAHACGHDVHTAALLGAGIALAGLDDAGRLPGRVRLVFQPAEEIMPGGAHEVMGSGAMADVDSVFALHCDPSLDVGRVGLREGALTGAADALTVRLSGRGGHTSRPHLTEDLTYAIGVLITQLPSALSRRLDPRAGASLVWGRVQAGVTHNVIPAAGEMSGTLRMLDVAAWHESEQLVRTLIRELVVPYGVTTEVTYVRGVPPVVNATAPTAVLRAAAVDVLGADAPASTSQSLGGEDFAWYLESVPGAMGRLGTRTPGGRTYDLHQGSLRVNERAVSGGAKLLAVAALRALEAEIR
ncbi:MAG: amidohydrolase [Actinomycetota bacterium]|nr:amidohydrolase [Actinomycetota bacterium]